MDTEYTEGDKLTFRGNEYKVEQADITPDGRVLQYRLEAINGPPATLIPNGDGEPFTVKEFHKVNQGEIEVNND